MAPKKTIPVLRDIAPTANFLHADAATQLDFKIADKDANGYLRELPENEILVMALNERAAQCGYGFFYYLPFREAWKKTDSIDLLPLSRIPVAPGSRYPDMLYMHYVWTEAEQRRFASDSQRARYLKCNAIINRLPDNTPLSAIQYIGYSSCPTYTTPNNTLVIFATKNPTSTYYLCTTLQLEHILKLWDKRWPASGPDPQARLNQPPEMWKRQPGPAPAQLRQLDPFKVPSPQAIYQEITRHCAPVLGDVPPSFTARELRDILPRPSQPEGGSKLGLSTSHSDTAAGTGAQQENT